MREKIKFYIRIVLIVAFCTIAGITALMFFYISNSIPDYTEEEEEEIPLYKQPLEKKLKTRGLLKIYFENTDYIDKKNEYVDAKVDSLVFYDDKGAGYGVILSTDEPYQTTFPLQEIKFHSQFLNQDGAFTFTYPGEVLNLKVDYKAKTYEFYEDESDTSD